MELFQCLGCQKILKLKTEINTILLVLDVNLCTQNVQVNSSVILIIQAVFWLKRKKSKQFRQSKS